MGQLALPWGRCPPTCSLKSLSCLPPRHSPTLPPREPPAISRSIDSTHVSPLHTQPAASAHCPRLFVCLPLFPSGLSPIPACLVSSIHPSIHPSPIDHAPRAHTVPGAGPELPGQQRQHQVGPSAACLLLKGRSEIQTTTQTQGTELKLPL